MFGNDTQEKLENRVKDLLDENRAQKVANEIYVKSIRADYEVALSQLRNDNDLAMKQKEFEIKHLADERVLKAEKENNELREQVAVLNKEKEMLERVVNLNADIVDVKELVKSLIAKLPTVDLQNLTINTNGGNK